MGHANGQISDSALVTIDRDARLLEGPAAAWAAIAAEVERRHGWKPRPTGSFDGYRPLSGNYYAQTETFLRRYEKRATGSGPYGDVRYWNGVRYVRVNGAAAAVPGTSNHGWACAVDVADLLSFTSERYRQFAEVAAEYGWTNTEGRSIGEYWHWVDVGNAHLVKNGLTEHGVVPDAPTLAPPAPIVPEEDIMASLQDLEKVVAPVLAGVNALLARDNVFKLDVPGAQAIYTDVSTSARLWLKTSADVRALAPRATIPLPPDDEFWARTVVYGVGELYRRKGDPSGAAYVLAGGVVNGKRVPTLRHVSAAEYAAMSKPLLVDVDPAHGLWRLPVLGAA